MKRFNVRNKELHIRMTEKQKNRLEMEAEELGVKVSEYARVKLLGNKSELNREMIELVVLVQDLVTYLQDKYYCKDDSEIVKRSEELWELL